MDFQDWNFNHDWIFDESHLKIVGNFFIIISSNFH